VCDPELSEDPPAAPHILAVIEVTPAGTDHVTRPLESVEAALNVAVNRLPKFFLS
jgi:hypothetical protein